MKKTIIAAMVAAMVSASAWADTASVTGTGMGLLQNEWVKAGVNTNTGTLGSGGSTSPGLLFDPTGTGTFNAAYDYLTPGAPFDGFSLKVDTVNKTNNNTGGIQITGDGTGLTLSNSNTTLSWSGSSAFGADTWSLTNAYTLAPNKPYIDITTTITAGGAASDVWFAKFIDPDSQGMAGDSSSTDNVLGYGAIPSTNVAFSEATVSRYALGLYSAASNVRAGINGWSSDAASYINADASCGTGVLYCNADDTIGLSFHWTGVTAGTTLTASYAYIFGPSAFTAASSAVDGGAGGGTPGTVPGGGTLVDVGSATTAASSSSTPTITGTTTTNGTPVIADTNGDSVVISTSMIAGDKTTRTYNSLTTTDVGRVTTTPTTIVTSYSDSTTTSAAGTPIVVSESYFHSVDVTDNDIATATAVNGTITRTSNGIDSSSLARSLSPVTMSQGSKSTTGSITGTITANELYTVVTPTKFTYARTTTTTTIDDFAPTSTYGDTISTTSSTSTVEETYDITTSDSVQRTAGFDATVNIRTDQVATVNKLQTIINRDIEFGKTITYRYYDQSNDGYNGYSTVFGIGHTKDIEGGMDLGIGINKIDTKLSGNNSSIQADTVQLGATLSKKNVEGFDLSGTIQHSMTNYTGSTTPQVSVNTYGDSRLLATQSFNYNLPAITGKTRGDDTSISVKAIGPGDIIRPVIGGTYGHRNVNGYTASTQIEGITITDQIGKVNQDYGYATVGAVVNYEMLNLTALHHTDGVNQYGVGLSKTEKDLTFNIRADRLETKQGGSTAYTAGLVYRF